MTYKALNIVFMGNPDFSVPSLKHLCRSRHEVLAVVTGTDKRRGRGGKSSPSPVKQAAIEESLQVIEADDMNSESLKYSLKALKPDILVVVAFKLLPPEILEIPSIGSVNLHASLLPAYRGAAPIHWALVNGEKETGCTIFLLDHGMDTGTILKQRKTPIGLRETTGDLYNRLKDLGAELMVETLNELADGSCMKIPQNETLATRAPKVTPGNARIRFHTDAMSVHNLIRGMSPFPGAWALLDHKKIKIYRTEPAPDIHLEPGKAALVDGVCHAGCQPGSIVINEIQPEGKKTVSGVDFMNAMEGRKVILQ